MNLRDEIAHRLCVLLDDDWSLGEKLYRSEADAILALVHAEVERLRGVLLHIECMKYADADELREIARQALQGDTHD